jgi:hypothetical protein
MYKIVAYNKNSLDFIQVVHLNKRKWIEASTYPHFTMIGHSLGAVYLAWEALTKFICIDTSGHAFTYPLAQLFGCKVICYTHYPTISSDMVERVSSAILCTITTHISLEGMRSANDGAL